MHGAMEPFEDTCTKILNHNYTEDKPHATRFVLGKGHIEPDHLYMNFLD